MCLLLKYCKLYIVVFTQISDSHLLKSLSERYRPDRNHLRPILARYEFSYSASLLVAFVYKSALVLPLFIVRTQLTLCNSYSFISDCYRPDPQMHYENTPIQIYRKFHLQKLKIFRKKNSDIFHISSQNIDCGYSLEPPRRGGSNEYLQSIVLSKNKKNNIYPCKPQFYYIKVRFKGIKII